MRIIIDICHPAHFHFFRNPINILRANGHEVVVTSRDKEMTLELIESEGWDHVLLCRTARNSSGLLAELVQRNVALFKLVRKFDPDVMAAIGGIFVAQVGALTRTPSVVFYDTENARLQNLLTYPFASIVSVPNCYESWVPGHTVRYAGYHELSYLQPNYFKPDIRVAMKNGLAPNVDTFLIRVVAWKANHDVGEEGWSTELLSKVVNKLTERGKVIISSEMDLPTDLQTYRFSGNPSEIHHLMAYCRLYIGESATMASESVVLGVPAIYVAKTGRGYCNQQEQEFGLLKNVKDLSIGSIFAAIDDVLNLPKNTIEDRWVRMMNVMADVPVHVVSLLDRSVNDLRGLKKELKDKIV